VSNTIIDERDQAFVLYEMLGVEEICSTPKFGDFSKDMFEMTLETALRLALDELYPANTEGDREGCRLEEGRVHVPKCFHRLKKLFAEGGWAVMSMPPEYGGQGFPYTLSIAATEPFIHNFSFLAYMFLASGAGHMIQN